MTSIRIRSTAQNALRQFIDDGTRFDALITDPPYDSGQFGAGKIEQRFAVLSPADCAAIVASFRQVLLPGADVYVFANWRTAIAIAPLLESAFDGLKSFIPWLKHEVGVGHYWRNCCEYVLHATNGPKERGPKDDRETYYPPAFLKLEGAGRRRLGAYQKPWEIYLRLLRPTIGRGARVIDPFAGSCPLECAAGMLGAVAYCIDIDFDWPGQEPDPEKEKSYVARERRNRKLGRRIEP